MFDKGNMAKLEQILGYIKDIFQIISNHNGIDNALSDKEGEYALMMCIVQIGETVSRITDPIINDRIPVAKIIMPLQLAGLWVFCPQTPACARPNSGCVFMPGLTGEAYKKKEEKFCSRHFAGFVKWAYKMARGYFLPALTLPIVYFQPLYICGGVWGANPSVLHR